MSAVWRCRVCEGVNRDGRICSTCGAEVPLGEPLRAAVRTVRPSKTQPATAPVPPSVSRRDLRSIPVPEEIYPVDSEGRLDFENGFDIRPMPGGCLVSFGPRRSPYS